MALQFTMKKDETNLKPRIVVIGIGGAGGNAVNNMIRSNLEGVEFLVCNTDSQALGQSLAERRIQLGTGITKGLGSGARPEIGQAAAEESLGEIMTFLLDAHMVFITAGMGGGTGTGAAPIVARAAREQGILTVGVVTKPFQFEGQHRMHLAEAGIEELQQYVDTLIMIPNQNLFRLANEKTTFADAFKMADDVLYSGVRGVTDLMVMPGLINLDFADIRTVMGEMGKAMMGTGEADSDKRAIDAAEAAISNPLLDDVSMRGAKGVLINITGGMDLTLFEVDEAANRIREEVDPDANIIFGSTFDETLEGRMRVSVVATGIDSITTTSTPKNIQQPLNQANPKITLEQPKSPVSLHKPQPAFRDTVGLAARTLQKSPFSPDHAHTKTHFVPPPSVSPEDVARDVVHPTQNKSNTNQTTAAPKPKSASLFQKIMGTGGHSAPSMPAEDQEEDEPLSLRDSAITHDDVVHKIPQGSSQPQEKDEEDILDIPAFLRRQAN